MAKDWRHLKQLIKEANVVVEVVDARDIRGTRLMLAESWAGKKLLIIANKKDLSENAKTPENCLLVSAKECDEKCRKRIISRIMEGIAKRPVKALFIGYPNVGKSSLINMLAKRRAAKVSSVAGTTKNVQWVNVNDELKVTDYRGVYPKGEEHEELMRKGAVNVRKDSELHAYSFAKRVLESERLREWVGEKFGIDMTGISDEDELFAAIARRRNLVVKGGEFNIEEAARILVRTLREAPEL
jgi:ribosome biogenesis GTPase A